MDVQEKQLLATRPVAMRARITFALLSLFGVSVVSNLLMLTGPLYMMQVYDRVLASRSLPTLVVITILVCGLYGFYAVLEMIRWRMGVRFGNLIETELGAKLLAASARLRLMSNPPAADPIRDGETLRQFAGGGGPIALMDLPWMPIYLAVVFLFHPMLGWLALGGALVITLLMLLNEALARQPARASSAAQLERQREADDVRSNAETIIAMGMMADIQQKWARLSGRLLDVQQEASDGAAFFTSIIKGLRFLLQSAVLALGAYLVIRGEMTGGLMIAASIVTSRAVAPVEQIVGQWRGFVAARQAYSRMRKVFNALPNDTRAVRLPLPRSKLSMHQLATAPLGMKTPLFSGGSFELAAGDGLGILGPSGSGKSSLARALVGIWPALDGEIRLDGALLSHYDPSQTGSIIGYLPQRVELLQGSVGDNIARFRRNATSEDIMAAARAANVHDLINGFPDGYDTDVGEHGALLSAGQQQRVGLARALFGNPFLIVLDEPNSNLDAEGDAALSDAIHQMRARGAIVVVVAHRPSAIAAVDKLLFVKDRRQVAFGHKNEVLRQVTQPSAGNNVRNIKMPAS